MEGVITPADTSSPGTLVKQGWDAAARGDAEVAAALWQEAAEQGDPDAWCFLAIAAERGGDIAEARRLYRRAADGGNLTAMVMVEMPLGDQETLAGDFLTKGFLARRRGVFTEMREQWNQAAAADDPLALLAAGLASYEASDDDAAVSHWERAAGFGDARAAWALGVLFAELGDEDLATAWRNKAARYGFTPA